MSKRHKREHGRILSVDEETLGTVLVADAASGATTLYVDDASEFEDDGTGGWLSINDQVIQYDTVDDDAGTIHLKTGLAAAADDGDPVYVWSRLYDTAATVKTALVMVDGEDDNTDPIHATLSDAVQDLPEGLRGEAGESCTLMRVSDDEWEVIAVGGMPTTARGIKFEDHDTFVTTAPGAQSFTLSHVPVDGSVHMAWGGLAQPYTAYSRDGVSITVPDPDSVVRAGDRFDFKYAWRAGRTLPLPIDWASPGWSYLPIAASDTTDRSAVGFDDSTWAVASAPFGDDIGHRFNYIGGVDFPAPVTHLDTMTAVWLRRSITGASGAATVLTRADNTAYVYWNGTQLTAVNTGTAQNSFSVSADLVTGSDVLAVRCEDRGPAGADNHIYLDVRVEPA